MVLVMELNTCAGRPYVLSIARGHRVIGCVKSQGISEVVPNLYAAVYCIYILISVLTLNTWHWVLLVFIWLVVI